MRKWILAILTGTLALIVSLYIFIPGKIAIQKSIVTNASQQAVSRLLFEDSCWKKWWSGNNITAIKDSLPSFNYDGLNWTITDKKYSSILLAIREAKDTVCISSLNIIAVSKDSVQLNWQATISSPANPLKRLQQWLKAGKIKSDMKFLLNKTGAFFSKPANIYGIEIRQDRVVDSTLISTYDSVKGYPDVAFIYGLIDELKKYIVSQQATITGYPMLNIFTKDSSIYLVKVALPVDKKLPSSGKMAYKWMLPGGYILATDVRGDSKAIDQAFKQLEYFVNDNNRHAPAIPFLSLITDRLQEKDSSKWITRIYYPVMD